MEQQKTVLVRNVVTLWLVVAGFMQCVGFIGVRPSFRSLLLFFLTGDSLSLFGQPTASVLN